MLVSLQLQCFCIQNVILTNPDIVHNNFDTAPVMYSDVCLTKIWPQCNPILYMGCHFFGLLLTPQKQCVFCEAKLIFRHCSDKTKGLHFYHVSPSISSTLLFLFLSSLSYSPFTILCTHHEDAWHNGRKPDELCCTSPCCHCVLLICISLFEFITFKVVVSSD
jgi:hypothetical protein